MRLGGKSMRTGERMRAGICVNKNAIKLFINFYLNHIQYLSSIHVVPIHHDHHLRPTQTERVRAQLRPQERLPSHPRAGDKPGTGQRMGTQPYILSLPTTKDKKDRATSTLNAPLSSTPIGTSPSRPTKMFSSTSPSARTSSTPESGDIDLHRHE